MHGAAPLSATQVPQQTVQADWDFDSAVGAVADFGAAVVDTGSAAAGAVGDAVGGAVRDVAMALVRRVAPQLEPILDEGPFAWLKRQLSSAFDGIAGALNALDPGGTLALLLQLFTGMVSRAAGIVAALASGDCQPLDAIGQLKDFSPRWPARPERLTSSWHRSATFGDLVGLRRTSAVEWPLPAACGSRCRLAPTVDWTAPVRDAVGDAWGWAKKQLFGADGSSGDSSGGIVGWVTSKAGEAWDWVKEQTRPVWQPVSQAAERIAELLPPPFLRDLGAQAGALSAQLEASNAAMDGGDAVAENRDTLASVLPGVQRIAGAMRGVIVRAGGWLGEKGRRGGGQITGLMVAASVSLLSALASALSWLGRGLTELGAGRRRRAVRACSAPSTRCRLHRGRGRRRAPADRSRRQPAAAAAGAEHGVGVHAASTNR